VTVYLDLVIGLNFLVDFLLLLGTDRLAGFPGSKKRLLAAAALGAVYSGACLLPGFRFLGEALWRVVSLILMCTLAFGWGAWKRWGVFLLLTMALGGMALRIHQGGGPVLILAALGLWILCRVAFGGQVGGQSYVPVEISSGEKTLRLLALRDTGNQLRDPITGERVVIIGPEAAGKLTGLTRRELEDPMGTLAARGIPGLRLIPYHSVGKEGGMLLGMRFSKVTVNGRVGSGIVAFAPVGMGDGVHQALIGGTV